MKKQSKAERKSRNTKGNFSAFRLPEIVCDKGNTDRCVFCGATVPEGRQVCPTCQVKFCSADREIIVPPKVGKTALVSDYEIAYIKSKKEGLI